MKFHFEPDLDCQHAAFKAVCALFQGQETCQNEFTVNLGRGHLPLARSAVCVDNRLTLLDDEILGTLHRIRIQYLLLANPANLF
jgi:type III restriction enzyme